MSHAATNWAIQRRGLKPATKIVLWHLCDRFNQDNGCFPDQETLAEDCEMSRSSLNEHLAALEEAELLRRVQRRDPLTRKQRSTRYHFPFEEGWPFGGETAEDREKPSPETGHGPESENSEKPSPEKPESRVQNLDSNNPGKEPGREPVERDARAKPEEPDPRPWEHDVQFMRAFNAWGMIDSISTAWRAWRDLTAQERTDAEARIPIYQARHAVRNKRIAFSKYLGEHQFKYLPDPATLPGSANAAASMMTIERFTRDWWVIFHRRRTADPAARDPRTGKALREMPAFMIMMATQHRFGIGVHLDDAPTDAERQRLVAVERGSDAFHAWAEYLRAAGLRIDDDDVAGQRVFMPAGTPPSTRQDSFSIEGARE